MDNKLAAVVIPIYKEYPDEYEIQSYLQCIKVLNQYDICLVVPENLNANFYTSQATVSLKRFPPSYFRGIDGYNRLLLSSSFYECFSDYDYLLIYQLDCYVFRDELGYWCSKNYDYIGAPWLDTPWHSKVLKSISSDILSSRSFFMRLLMKIGWYVRGLVKPSRVNVGNGGCSLRKVKTFREVTQSIEERRFVWSHNEDLFWSIYMPLTSFKFRISDWKKAIFFSFDYKPQLSYAFTKGKLPFAAHGWFRNDEVYRGNLEFWQPIIKSKIGQV